LRSTLIAVLLALAPPAGASEPEGWESTGLHQPAGLPPPDRESSFALTSELIAQVQGGVDPAWLERAVRPAQLAAPPSPEWYSRLASSLSTGALGDALRASSGPIAAFEGPDYVRVLLGGDRLFSVVVRRRADDSAVIDRIQPTTCTLCDEPSRYVRDLLADITRRRSASGRLIPGVELYVGDHLAENPAMVPHHWLASLQARNQQGGGLQWLLIGARVAAVRDEEVTVQFADGRLDRWTVSYRFGRWQVDYHTLPEDSPLRMSAREAREWRTVERRANAALHGWTPSFFEVGGGVGVQVGNRAVGAAFDPRDGTILVGVLDLDRVLAGVFRVDVEQRAVIERWAIPPPPDTTPILLGTWFERWHMALSPDGREVAMTLPGRLWHLDLRTGRTRLVARTGAVRTLQYARTADGHALLVGEDRGDVMVVGPDGTHHLGLGYSPVHLGLDNGDLMAVTEDGVVHWLPLVGGERTEVAHTCGEEVVDAAVHPDGTEILVSCGPGSEHLAERVQVPGGESPILSGAATHRAATSWSPDGTLFTTGAAGTDPVLLWDALEDRPIATLGTGEVRAVSWSPDGNQVVTVGADGRAWLWDVHRVRMERGLSPGRSALP
jgi:hypothetical protein